MFALKEEDRIALINFAKEQRLRPSRGSSSNANRSWGRDKARTRICTKTRAWQWTIDLFMSKYCSKKTKILKSKQNNDDPFTTTIETTWSRQKPQILEIYGLASILQQILTPTKRSNLKSNTKQIAWFACGKLGTNLVSVTFARTYNIKL